MIVSGVRNNGDIRNSNLSLLVHMQELAGVKEVFREDFEYDQDIVKLHTTMTDYIKEALRFEAMKAKGNEVNRQKTIRKRKNEVRHTKRNSREKNNYINRPINDIYKPLDYSIKKKDRNKVVCYTDGGSKKGYLASSYLVMNTQGSIVQSNSKVVLDPEKSRNGALVAEIHGIYDLIEYLYNSQYKDEQVVIYVDNDKCVQDFMKKETDYQAFKKDKLSDKPTEGIIEYYKTMDVLRHTCKYMDVTLKHTLGHRNNFYNTMVDAMCTYEIKKQLTLPHNLICVTI